MCENTKALYENMKPYIRKNPVLDIVETKFGLSMLENAGHRALWIEHSMVESFDDLLFILMQNIEMDVLEDFRIKELNDDAIHELRRRVTPFFVGLPDEAYAKEQLDIFIAEHLE